MRKSRTVMAASETTPTPSSPESPAPSDRSVGDVAVRFVVPLVWAFMPLLAGPALGDALDGRDRPVQLVATIGLWVVWAVALGLSLVPRSTSLTAIRIIIPTSVIACGWTFAGVASVGVPEIVALTASLVVTVLVMAAFTGDLFVNGSSYGDERRLPLRAPAGLLLGPIEMAWLVCVIGACAGPLLLGAQSWIAGGILLVVGWPAAYFAARALHGLAQRWIVFVPAGFVLHDQMAITDPLLVPRKMVVNLGPAPADTSATDFTLGSFGLALQVDLNEPTPVTPVPKRTSPGQRPALEAVDVQSILFTPTRPGALLREARKRRLPVG